MLGTGDECYECMNVLTVGAYVLLSLNWGLSVDTIVFLFLGEWAGFLKKQAFLSD